MWVLSSAKFGLASELMEVAIRSLNQLSALRNAMLKIRWWYLVRFWGMDIHPSVRISLKARLDRTYPKGIHIGEETLVAFDSTILSHDMCRGLYMHTRVGSRCFIGAGSIILPGITVGDHCIVGAGSVVTKDVPSGSIVVGNPAVVIKSGMKLSRYGKFPDSEARKMQAVENGAFK